MFKRSFESLLVLLVFGGFLVVVSPSACGAGLDFNRDIRPILSDNCFSCHGPDEAKRKAGLRLDRHEDALKPAKSGDRAIVPGDVTKSSLIGRITATDEDDRMPPASSGKKLTPQQIDLLRRWIQEGADWKTHWAFTPPTRSEAPAVQHPGWVKNDIDSFVLARLEKEKLAPAPEADRTTLIRRASLDLTGLPPTVEEVDAFLADGTTEAYDKLVDRLLTSPRYGEHQARYWLDAVRYADTHGYHIDSRRDMWKYRDWVIQAFNDNKPFDQFTTEQLAGDLLPNASLDQQIASGYVRANMTTGEGGVIEDEYRAKYTFDRVETTGTVFLGMTLVCARCHTHKYDPIQQREYYSLYAIFNQVADPVMDENKPNPAPFIRVPSKGQAARQAWLQEHIRQRDDEMKAPQPGLDDEQVAWESRWRERLETAFKPLRAATAQSLVTNGASLRPLADGSILAEGPNPGTDTYEINFALEPGPLSALRLEALPDVTLPAHGAGRAADGQFSLAEFEAELVRAATGGGTAAVEQIKFARSLADAEEKDHTFSKALDANGDSSWQVPTNTLYQPHRGVLVPRQPMSVNLGDTLRVRLRHAASVPNAALGRFRISATTGEAAQSVLHPSALSAWQVLGPLKGTDPHAALTTNYGPEISVDLTKKYPGVREEAAWIQRPDLEDGRAQLLVQDLHGVHGVRYLYRTLTLSTPREYSLDLRADGLFRLWVNGQLVAERDHEETPGEGPLSVTVPLREGENQFLLKLVTIQGASYFTFSPDLGYREGLSADVAAILAVGASQTEGQSAKVRQYFRRQRSDEFRVRDNELSHWREESATLERFIPTTLVAKESETPRETFLLMRGEYDKKGDKVSPDVPSIFPRIPAGAPTNRLGLAKWLLDPAHPLTARVTVNRIWQQYFGVGLVKTTEDFGLQGEHPSHPELLDWLATEFRDSGWNVKHLHRLIVTSATYRQSSHASKELVVRDPENRMLARGPRFRLDAEGIRDLALDVSGLLSAKVGGRSVRPYEPPGLWEAVSFNNSQRYTQDSGEAQYRRSLYTFWKRQSPPPTMLIFDAPSRESCSVRRSRSNTPLQALALLNDPQFVEASRALAERILREGGPDLEARIRYAFRLATARVPDPAESDLLGRLFKAQLYEFQQNPASADALLTVGSFIPDARWDRAELAAWASVASLILNLDETVTKS